MQVNSTARTDLDGHLGRDGGQAAAPGGEVGVGGERRLQAGEQRHHQLLIPGV